MARRRAPGARAGLAGPRRSRRRRLRAARRRVHAPLGGGRAGHRAPHVGGRRAAADGPAPRLRRRPPGQPLLGVPADDGRPSSPGGWAARTPSSRSGTACRGSRPVWYRRPHMTILHHVHGPMWDQIMPAPLAGAGRFLEARLAPPFYRRTPTVTPSEATRQELLGLGFRPELVTAVDNGVDRFFTPGGDALAGPDGRRRRPAWPRSSASGCCSTSALDARRRGARPARADRRRGPAARRPRALDRRARRRRLGRAARPRVAGPAARRVPPGLARRQRVAGRGLGAVADRGRGVRHAGRGAPTSAATAARSSTGATGLLVAARRARRRRSPTSLTDDGLRRRLADAALARARTLTWDASALGVLRVFHRRSWRTP